MSALSSASRSRTWTRSRRSPAPGPAYFALLAEAMIEAGILLGLSREVSTQLVVQTMLGTAKQLRDLKMHPVELREMVTSPGGTTIAAIRELEQAGVRAAFLNAIQAAMDRSRELARGDRSLDDVDIRVVDDPATAARRLLAHVAAAGGHVALSGGSTVGAAYERGGRAAARLARTPTSGSATTARCRRTTSARTTGSCARDAARPARASRRRCIGSAASSAPRRRPRSTTRSSTASRSTWR